MDRIRELIKLAKNGDANAKSTIISENTGLIWSIVRKFRGRGYEMEDLFQIGAIGLIRCVDKFDLDYDVKFSTYAVPMIIGEIKRFIRDDGLIKVSRPIKELSVRAKYAQEAFLQKEGRMPTIEELAKILGADKEDLVLAMDSAREVESIYSTVNQSDGNPVYLIDKLCEKDQDEEHAIDMITLKEILSHLDAKQRQIIMMRYFDDKTQSEVAKVLGISQVQVSRIEKKVIGLIRERFG